MNRFSFFSFCLLAALCTQATFAETPVAYVYVQTAKGVNVYNSSTTGTLTLVSGSPFQTTGLMIGSNGTQLITLGTDNVYSYKVASNGAIGAEVSHVDTRSYAGSQCGTTAGAVLDHNGQNIYVFLKGTVSGDGTNLCDALQTWSISPSSSELTFKGNFIVDQNNKSTGDYTLPVFLGNDTFAYDSYIIPDACELSLNPIARESSGLLQPANDQYLNNPTAAPGYYYYVAAATHTTSTSPWPSLITDDPTDHIAVAMYAENNAPCGTPGPLQLASFTADKNGSLATSSTYKNMPSVAGGSINVMRGSPAGNLLAVATGTGVQIFHFNGANPITAFTGVIGTSGFISDLQWDKSNHLYAINGSSGKVHVYTVTTTSAVEASGSPYLIGASDLYGAGGLIVVSK
jgi:hypothetical protein